jgi:hypothetical protein
MGIKLPTIAKALDLLSAHGKSVEEWEVLLYEQYLQVLEQFELPLLPARIRIEYSNEFCFKARDHWSTYDRVISISWRLIVMESWAEVLVTLKHEVAHQAARELLRCRDDNECRLAFRKFCDKLGIPEEASDHLRTHWSSECRGNKPMAN